RARKAAVALERGLAVLRADEPLGRLVELPRGHARARLVAQHRQAARQDAARGRDPLDLLGRLADDHRAQAYLRTDRVCEPCDVATSGARVQAGAEEQRVRAALTRAAASNHLRSVFDRYAIGLVVDAGAHPGQFARLVRGIG